MAHVTAQREDAVVVGAGPNGLAAAATLARAGRRVRVLEAATTPGGGCRSAALTVPGFVHDVCAAIHPLGAASPTFGALGLTDHGLEWRHPPLPLAHPFDDGSAAVLHRSLEDTVAGLGPGGPGWRRLVGPMLTRWSAVLDAVLAPVLPPRRPLALLRASPAVLPATVVAHHVLGGHRDAAALLAGCAAHGAVPLHRPVTTGPGLLLAAAGHASGWPVAAGGSQAVIDALVRVVEDAGGVVECGRPVRRLDDLPAARATLLDVTPRQLVELAGPRLSPAARRRLLRFRYGPGVFKLDYALAGPVPWTAEACRRAGTVHLGGTLEEIAEAEEEVARGRHPRRPFVLVGQQSMADPSRAPAGSHTLWAYCHVPNGSPVDMTAAIEGQLDRYAPGWRDLVVARHHHTPAELQAYNANDVGGDIAGGSLDGWQALFRPRAALDPYRTPVPGTFLCSASTPPGAGVHGRCGELAARAALSGELR